MKEMSIKDIQRISLEILKDVHSFCVEHGINYTLFGGTMIGAIRHKGFIPWDDDVDIAMPRPDYERFLSIYQSKNGYKLFPSGAKGNYLAFSRVCEMQETLVVNEKAPWSNEPTGVWIDIFPLDGAPDNKDECIKLLRYLRKLWVRCCYARGARSSFGVADNYVEKAKLLMKKIVFNNRIISNEMVVSKFIKEASSIGWGQTNHFWNCSYLRYGMKEYQEMGDYKSSVLVPFEGENFFVCNGFDHLMRTKYGNYMQLPEKSKQISNHRYVSYFWKY